MNTNNKFLCYCYCYTVLSSICAEYLLQWLQDFVMVLGDLYYVYNSVPLTCCVGTCTISRVH